MRHHREEEEDKASYEVWRRQALHAEKTDNWQMRWRWKSSDEDGQRDSKINIDLKDELNCKLYFLIFCTCTT